MKHKVWLVMLAALGVFILDRWTKIFFYAHPQTNYNLIPQWLWLHLQLNRDMALSLPLYPVVYFSLTAVVLVALVGRFVRAIRHQLVFEFCVILFILVGAVSNFLDRFIYGGVVDFIQIRLGSIFNLADMSIVVAVGIWIGMLFYQDRSKKNNSKMNDQQKISAHS